MLAVKAQNSTIVKEQLKLAERQKLLALMLIAFLVGIFVAKWIINNHS